MTDVQSRFRVSFFLSLPDPLHFAFGIPAFSASDFPCLFPGFLCPFSDFPSLFSDFCVRFRAFPVRIRFCGVLVRLFSMPTSGCRCLQPVLRHLLPAAPFLPPRFCRPVSAAPVLPPVSAARFCRPVSAARSPFLPVCSAFGKKSAVDSSDAALIGGLSCDVGATC